MNPNPRIYLDYNASTPIDPRVLKALISALENERGNPSSIHLEGQQSRRLLEQSRQAIAHFFQVKPQEIIFNSGGTEGAALLIHGVMQRQPQGHIITSRVEHSCVYQNVQDLEKKGYAVTFLSTGLAGAVKAEEVAQAIRPDTRLITLMAVNNETGVKTDIEVIAAIAQKSNIPFVVDGVCWLGKEPLQLPAGVSAAFFSGHKIYAPKGIGVCVCRQTLKLAPLFRGGEQELQRRAGTENLSGIVALAQAITLLKEEQEALTRHLTACRDRLEQELQADLGDVLINGQGPRISNTTNLSFLGVDGEALLMNLDLEGISVSHGSACSSGALEPSRILLEMGTPLAQARTSIRFSVGRMTTQEEVIAALAIIKRLVFRLRQLKNR